jgi:hypothetical protein
MSGFSANMAGDGLAPSGPADGGGGLSGEAGTASYDSGADGLTFSSQIPNSEREIEFSGTDGEIYVINLVFGGAGRDGFQIVSTTDSFDVESAREVAFDCDSDGNFVHGFDEPDGGGASGKIKFRAIYVDGTAKSMTVEIWDAGKNVLLDTITATATIIDPFLAEAVNQGADFLYCARDKLPGILNNSDVVMEDLIGGEPDMLATLLPGTVDWGIVATTSFVSPSLGQVLSCITRNAATDFALVNALSSPIRALLAIVRIVDKTGGVTEGWVCTDTTSNLNHVLEYLNPSAVGSASPNPGFTNFPHGGADWMCGCIRQSGTTDWQHWSEIGGTWEDIGTQTWSDTYAMRDSLRVGFTNNVLTGTKRIEIAAIVGWFTNPGEAALEAVYGAAA